LEAAFGTTQWRRQLLSGLRAALEALRVAGCRRAYVDGSFVTAKEVPGDFDGCWEAEDVDPDALDPVLLDFLDIHVRHRRWSSAGRCLSPTLRRPLTAPGSWTSSKSTRTPATQRGIVAIDLGAL